MQRFREGCCGYCLAIHQMTRPMIATPAPLFLSGIVALYPLVWLCALIGTIALFYTGYLLYLGTMQRFREGCCGYCLAIHQMTRPMIATPASITA
jgi:hypothetical protein